jgi:predicted transcriptional regulator
MTTGTKTTTIRLDQTTDQHLTDLAAEAGVSRNRLLTTLITDRYTETRAQREAATILDDITANRRDLIDRLRDA